MQKNLINEEKNSEDELSLEEEFAAYLNESKTSEVVDNNIFPISSSGNEDSFEDVSEDLINKED